MSQAAALHNEVPTGPGSRRGPGPLPANGLLPRRDPHADGDVDGLPGGARGRARHESGGPAMTQTVADVLLARLREWGVRQVFGFPGDGINGLLAAWGRADDRPQFVQARHEEMAAFEAVGYAKFSGTVGACAAT